MKWILLIMLCSWSDCNSKEFGTFAKKEDCESAAKQFENKMQPMYTVCSEKAP